MWIWAHFLVPSFLTRLPAFAFNATTSLASTSWPNIFLKLRGAPMSQWPVHGTITGPIGMIGFGSIGRGTLPLIERHFNYDKSRFTVIDPDDKDCACLLYTSRCV